MLYLINTKTIFHNGDLNFSGENLFFGLFSVFVISFSFIDLNEDVWTGSVCVCVFGLLLMGPFCFPISLLCMIPARLNGRALDWLSDEMMILLWEAIPKWEVSDKDCTLLWLPRCPPVPHCQLHRWWLIFRRWITGSTHWFFSVLSKNIYLQLCL